MKYAFINTQTLFHSLVRLCCALSVSRSGYYYWKQRQLSHRQQYNHQVLEEIKVVHGEVMETYGSPRMHRELLARGFELSRGRVERVMRSDGIQAKQAKRRKRTIKHREGQAPEPNILARQFYALKPNEKWVSDITFIETREGWLYLAIILDLYSRAIVGWSMSQKIDGQLVRDALLMAINQRGKLNNTLVHSDQGCQYTSASYRQLLSSHGLVCSMSRKGECHDNAVAESFFHTLKNELVHDAKFETRAVARQSIFKYIELFYNRKRRHSTINYQAPLEYENIMNQ